MARSRPLRFAPFLLAALAACRAASGENGAPPATTTAAPSKAPDAASSPSADVSSPASAPSGATPGIVRISAVGDVTLGDAATAERAPGSFHRFFDEVGPLRPFSMVDTVFHDDDLTIANLEGPLTLEPPRQNALRAFRGRMAFGKILQIASVELVNIANNHIMDCGPRGIKETKEALRGAEVAYFGLGRVDTRWINGVEVHNLGFTGGQPKVKDEVVELVSAIKRPDNLVIVTFHWGIEGSHEVMDVQESLAHAVIDAGGDLVIGHHPHVLQAIETYKGKKILYSLGNFLFGGAEEHDELESIIYRARFQKTAGVVSLLDDELIPVIVAADGKHNDFLPLLAGDERGQEILDNVAQYSKNLKDPLMRGGKKLPPRRSVFRKDW
ncbi:MAG: CapA family protein [Polyangiaceae bacterium]